MSVNFKNDIYFNSNIPLVNFFFKEKINTVVNCFLDKKESLKKSIESNNINEVKKIRSEIEKINNDNKILLLLLKIFSTMESKKLEEGVKFELDRAKFVIKLNSIDSSRLQITDEAGEPRTPTVENDLIDLLFVNHIFEKMAKFDHKFDRNEEPKFRFTNCTNLKKLFQNRHLQDIEEQVECLQNQKGATLRIKGEFNDGRYREVLVDETAKEQLSEIIKNKEQLLNIHLISPIQFLTIQELIDKKILYRDTDRPIASFFSITSLIARPVELKVSPCYQYLERGFTRQPLVGWSSLTPYRKLRQPSQTFRLEILTHLPQHGPQQNGPIKEQIIPRGHSSLQLTTPSGEVYSIGFLSYDDTSNGDPQGHCTTLKKVTKIHQGVFESPDHYIFLPHTSWNTKYISLTFDKPEIFHQILSYIELLSGCDNKNSSDDQISLSSNVPFHQTHHNCTAFADLIAKRALKLGAKVVETPTLTPLENGKIRCHVFLLNLLFHIRQFLYSIFHVLPIETDQNLKEQGFNFTLDDLTAKGVVFPTSILPQYAQAKLNS